MKALAPARLYAVPRRLASLIARYATILVVPLAVIAFVIDLTTMGMTFKVPVVVAPLIAIADALPLLLMARWPMAAWGVAAGMGVVWSLAFDPKPPAEIPWPVMLFIVQTICLLVAMVRARLPIASVAAVVSVIEVLALFPPNLRGAVAAQYSVIGVGLVVRMLIAFSGRVATQQDELEQASELTASERAGRQVWEERGRIAHELHDVVAHHMSMIVVQAGSAPVRISDLSEETKSEFAAIEHSARQALTEIREVLGVLRTDDHAASLEPAPAAGDVRALLPAARSAGMDIGWQVRMAREYPAAIELALHRILGEALANASRHAPGARVEVRIDQQDDAMVLQVTNSAGNVPAAPETGGGQGMAGMRSRAEALGGRLDAGPTADGGFVVTAVLPLTSQVALSREIDVEVEA